GRGRTVGERQDHADAQRRLALRQVGQAQEARRIPKQLMRRGRRGRRRRKSDGRLHRRRRLAARERNYRNRAQDGTKAGGNRHGTLLLSGKLTGSDAAGKSGNLAPGLYVTATPIGNAQDVTLRALKVLKECDLIAAEDTRVTLKLLGIHGIARPLSAYNDHNAARERPKLLARLRQGARIALVSDAGTPLISDPGFKLVREAVQEGLPVHAIPGASAVMTGLALAGLPTDRFLF